MQCPNVRASGFANDDAVDICVCWQEKVEAFSSDLRHHAVENFNGPKVGSCNAGACQPLCIVSRIRQEFWCVLWHAVFQRRRYEKEPSVMMR